MDTHTNTLLSWSAKAKVDHSRGGTWYIVSGIFCGFMVMYGILSGSYSVTAVFVLLPVAFYLVRHKSHQTHNAEIVKTGFQLDNTLTPWDELKEFWILQGNGYYELHIAPKNTRKADLVIQTGEKDPFAVRNTLLAFIPQTTAKREKLLDAIIRFCKL